MLATNAYPYAAAPAATEYSGITANYTNYHYQGSASQVPLNASPTAWMPGYSGYPQVTNIPATSGQSRYQTQISSVNIPASLPISGYSGVMSSYQPQPSRETIQPIPTQYSGMNISGTNGIQFASSVMPIQPISISTQRTSVSVPSSQATQSALLQSRTIARQGSKHFEHKGVVVGLGLRLDMDSLTVSHTLPPSSASPAALRPA